MNTKVITISREFGSGGRTIGREVAQKLGIPCYDHELIDKVASESGFDKDYIAEQGEYANESWLANQLGAFYGSVVNRDSLWLAQRKVILDLAQRSCVIVGRCADYILQDKVELLTVFIHADMKFRADRIVRLYGESDDSPERRLKQKDKRRAAYYRYYTDIDWGVAKNYDIALDSGRIGIEKCVDMIAALYRQ